MRGSSGGRPGLARWWYGAHLRAAAIRIQRHFRGWRGWKRARTRKRGSWRVWRTCDTRRCSFGSGRGESTPRRFAACDSSLRRRIRDASGRGDEGFESWRNRAERGAAFRVGVERLAVAIAWRRAAPIFVTWRVAARRRVRQKRVAVRLLTSANRRAKSYFFQTWARVAAGLARARVLDTAAHARAAEETAAAAEKAASRATEAWAAARRVAV